MLERLRRLGIIKKLKSEKAHDTIKKAIGMGILPAFAGWPASHVLNADLNINLSPSQGPILERAYLQYTYNYTHIYIYIYMYLYVYCITACISTLNYIQYKTYK